MCVCERVVAAQSGRGRRLGSEDERRRQDSSLHSGSQRSRNKNDQAQLIMISRPVSRAREGGVRERERDGCEGGCNSVGEDDPESTRRWNELDL